MNTEDEMISVPAQVLQDLIHNIELASIGIDWRRLASRQPACANNPSNVNAKSFRVI